MKIVFLSNYFNHHQQPLASELYSLLGEGNYFFITTTEIPDYRRELGYKEINVPYVLKFNNKNAEAIRQILLEADVLVFGGSRKAFDLAKERVHAGKLTFQMSERWLKRGFINMFSPNLLNETKNYWIGKWYKKPIYRLCMSAFAPNDLYLLHQFKDKCYKWAYFTKVQTISRDDDSGAFLAKKCISIMWCARFLELKHPELPVLLAERLKRKGYCFSIDMFGSGEKYETIREMIEQKELSNEVHLCGKRANEEILEEMRCHDLFLFTSDRHEGWGAVLNEAMSNGCIPIASNEIGSVPYLLKDGENGMVFQSRNLESLEEKILYLLDNPNLIPSISVKARETLQLWSPNEAAKRLIKLIDSINKGEDTPFAEGPCSKAYPVLK